MRPRTAAVFGLIAYALPAVASAHAFGVQFTLPLPVDFYVIGGICAFVASCAILLLFSEPAHRIRTAQIEIPFRMPSVVRYALAAVGLVLFAACLVLSLFGSQSYITNPLPNFFWIIFLLLFAYASAIIGGLWEFLNPFQTIARWTSQNAPNHTPPQWLYYLPSVGLILLLILELYSGGLGAAPIVLGIMLLFVSVLSNVASLYLGSDTWFRYGDTFSALLRIFSMVAPIQIERERIVLALPAERLVQESASHISTLVFTLILLGSTMLDGLRETMLWQNLLRPIPPAWDNYVGIAALIGAVLLLSVLYWVAIYLMSRFTRSDFTTAQLRLRFAYSLIPIAIAYHFAHYFSLILSQGQVFLAQISDPMHVGSNFFGTSGREIDFTLVGADTVWYVQLSAIVLGHMLAAFVAHRIAQRTFATKHDVLVSQLPMLVLMVGLTALGLWTLAQPFAN